jgi:hypothetical protein
MPASTVTRPLSCKIVTMGRHAPSPNCKPETTRPLECESAPDRALGIDWLSTRKSSLDKLPRAQGLAWHQPPPDRSPQLLAILWFPSLSIHRPPEHPEMP